MKESTRSTPLSADTCATSARISAEASTIRLPSATMLVMPPIDAPINTGEAAPMARSTQARSCAIAMSP